jgi:hypothetical protein
MLPTRATLAVLLVQLARSASTAPTCLCAMFTRNFVFTNTHCFRYHWQGGKYKKPTLVSAPVYIDLLMDWVRACVTNDSLLFASFSISFVSEQRMCRRTCVVLPLWTACALWG